MKRWILLLLLFQEEGGDQKIPLANSLSFYQSYLLMIKFSNPKMSNNPMDLWMALLSLDGGL